jgi:methionyl-tRNA formyltransferase
MEPEAMSQPRRRLGIAGCKHTTLELIQGLARHGFKVDHVLTLAPDMGAKFQVAGYLDLRPHLDALGVPWSHAHKYSLKCEEDEKACLALKLDALLVMGWQRLIPEWFLAGLRCGAYGMHGSSRPLPQGRGRSPMNWSLIQGKTGFLTHLFRYEPAVDDGQIVGVSPFDITPWDDCRTLHCKNTIVMVQLCAKFLPAILEGTVTLSPQADTAPSYYPKRSETDGIIHWSDTTQSIFNLVRGVTRPFPGAFGFLDDDPARKIRIWRLIPFDTRLNWPGSIPGEILEVFQDQAFVVRTGDGTALVLESEGQVLGPADVGRRLGHLGQPPKDWGPLPD